MKIPYKLAFTIRNKERERKRETDFLTIDFSLYVLCVHTLNRSKIVIEILILFLTMGFKSIIFFCTVRLGGDWFDIVGCYTTTVYYKGLL